MLMMILLQHCCWHVSFDTVGIIATAKIRILVIIAQVANHGDQLRGFSALDFLPPT